MNTLEEIRAVLARQVLLLKGKDANKSNLREIKNRKKIIHKLKKLKSIK